MANTKAGSVFRIDTAGTIYTGPTTVCGVLYIAGTGTPTASITDIAGNAAWETAESTRGFDQAHFRIQEGIKVTLAGTGTVLYIYTK